MASQSARILPGTNHRLRFWERDDFTGATAGYHFKQLLLNDKVIWEEDVAGGTNDWRRVEVDLSNESQSSNRVVITFRLLDKKGVTNFGVRWRLKELQTEGLQLEAGLDKPEEWKAEQHGAFEAGFGAAMLKGQRRFHIPLMVMTAAQPSEFKLRHGEPASPERINQWLRMCLAAMREGKCEGVVTYCLDKGGDSPVFPLARDLFRESK